MLRACILLAGLLVAAPARAGDEDADLARLLPPDTPCFMDARTPTPAEAQDMAIYRCLQDKRMSALLQRIMSDENSFSKMTIPLGSAGLSILTDVTNPAFAMEVKYVDPKGERRFRFENRFAAAWIGMADGTIPVDVVAALRVNTAPSEAIVTLQRIIAAVVLKARGSEDGDVDAEIERIFTTEAHRGVSIVRAEIESYSFYMVPLGPLVAFATTRARVHDMIQRRIEPNRPSLATDPRHLQILGDAPGTGTPTTMIAINADRVLARLQPHFPVAVAQIRGVMAQIGLGGLQSLSIVARVDGTGVTSTSAIRFSGPRSGLGNLFEPGAPAKYDCLSFAPQATLYAMCGKFEPARLFEIATEVGGLPVAMAAAGFKEEFGFRLREDFLDLMGPEGALIVSSNRGLIPDVGVVLESKDAGKLTQAVLKMLGTLEWPEGAGVQSIRIGGARAYTIPLGHPELLEFPIAPTFGAMDGKFLVTVFPVSWQRFAAVRRGERPSLAKNRDFASLRERVPEDALGMSYLDLVRFFEILYDTGVPLLQALPGQFGSPPHYELPDVDIFSQHLFGRIGWRRADETGMYWQSYSSIDLSAVFGTMVLGAGVGTLLFVGAKNTEPPVVELEAPAPKAGVGLRQEALMCRKRVRKLRAKLLLYRQEHGAFPAQLAAIAADLPARALVAPGAKRPYLYFGPQGRGGILLHGHVNGDDELVSILTTKLVLRRVSAQELQSLLAAEAGSERR